MSSAGQDNKVRDIARTFSRDAADPNRYFMDNVYIVYVEARIPRRGKFVPKEQLVARQARELVDDMRKHMGAEGKLLQVHSTAPVGSGRAVTQQIVFGVPSGCEAAFRSAFRRPRAKRPRVTWGAPMPNSWVEAIS